MATFALIPGAGGRGVWYFHRVEPLLRAAGHRSVSVDLPSGDESATIDDYADTVLDALGQDTGDLVVVGQSLGGFTAPLVAARAHARLIVLLNAMIPAPGENAGVWWGNTGQSPARIADAQAKGRDTEFDPIADFFHDLPAEVTEQAMAMGEPEQADGPFVTPWPLPAWPDIPTRVIAGRDDRLFPLEFQRRVARERLGVDTDELPGGHLLALSRPEELATLLLRYLD